MKKISRLQLFEFRNSIKTHYSFLLNVVYISVKGFLSAILVLLIFVILDNLGSYLFNQLLYFSNNNVWCSFANFLLNLNKHIHIDTSQLAYCITIAASVLGVLLGLYFTTFITIVSTKYAQINSEIRVQLLAQRTINNYFQLLSGIISLSFLYQFLLVFGYQPTLVSCVLMALVVLAAIGSFVGFGKFSLAFYDTSFLVTELLDIAKMEITKIVTLKNEITSEGKGRNYLGKIYNSIERIGLIIHESKNPNLTDTSLDVISEDLLAFAIDYNQVKYRIPSTEGWHLQAYKVKRWHQARDLDFSISRSSGIDLLPQLKDDTNRIEKKIIDVQFDLFDYYIRDGNTIFSIYNQHKYLQVLAFQADSKLFSYFFERIEKFIGSKISESNNTDLEFHLQLASLYSNFAINSFVGLNHNLNLFKIDSLKKLATAIHNGLETDGIMTLPYYVREWIDQYSGKINIEKELSGGIVTPIFYTEYELVLTITQKLSDYWRATLNFLSKSISRLTQNFENASFHLCALELNLELTEFNSKINIYLQNTRDLIISFNTLNWQKEKPLYLNNLAGLEDISGRLVGMVKDNIWRTGTKAIFPNDEGLPDIQGRFYQLISYDIIDKLLQKDPDPKNVKTYLNQYNLICFEYIEILRLQIRDSEDQVQALSIIYPIVRDLFEVQAIAFIVGKIYNPLINENIFNFWNQTAMTEKEANTWPLWFTVYNYYSQPMLSLSTSSYIKETDRNKSVLTFLKDKELIKKEYRKTGGLSLIAKYETFVEDIYIKTLVNGIDSERSNDIALDQVFVEIFLRTRISLQSLNIKETNYGRELGRFMERANRKSEI